MFNPIEEKRRFVQAKIQKSFNSGINVAEEMDLEKAVYTDNPQNRKLGRVGQEYGGKGSRGGKKAVKLPDTFRLPVKDSNLTRKVSGVSYTLNHASYDKQRGTIIVSATHPDGRKSEKTFHYNTDGELKKMQAAVKRYLETDGDRKSDPRDKIAQDGGFKDYEEMKGYQDYVTQKNLLKKKSTKAGMRLLYQQEVAKYEKDHRDLIKRIG